MRDIAFLLLTAGFFGLNVLFVRACERLVGVHREPGEERAP